MAGYRLLITPRAEKALSLLPDDYEEKVSEAVFQLAVTPRPTGSAKLAGSEQFRIRIGPYRAAYEIDDAKKTVLVTAIEHRSKIYHKLKRS